MHSSSIARPGTDPLAGIPILSAETQGRYSTIEQIALKLRDDYGPDSAASFDQILDLSATEVAFLGLDPWFSLRPVQVPPENFKTWFFLGGRGAGKTYAGACAVIEEAKADPEARIMIVGPTYSEIIKNQIKGPSGILTLSTPWFMPKFEPSKKLLTFPNGAQATWLPAGEPDKFRGHAASFEWLDEIVAWKKDAVGTFKESRTIMRHTTARMRKLGLSTRQIITTSPAPTLLFREVLEQRDGMRREEYPEESNIEGHGAARRDNLLVGVRRNDLHAPTTAARGRVGDGHLGRRRTRFDPRSPRAANKLPGAFRYSGV